MMHPAGVAVAARETDDRFAHAPPAPRPLPPPGTRLMGPPEDGAVAWAERRRIAEQGRGDRAWSLWGPYLSERQWGTVREDYSADGEAWDYLSHDRARSTAYRWGEDGLAGFSDIQQRLCLGLALWNGRDPILKE